VDSPAPPCGRVDASSGQLDGKRDGHGANMPPLLRRSITRYLVVALSITVLPVEWLLSCYLRRLLAQNIAQLHNNLDRSLCLAPRNNSLMNDYYTQLHETNVSDLQRLVERSRAAHIPAMRSGLPLSSSPRAFSGHLSRRRLRSAE